MNQQENFCAVIVRRFRRKEKQMTDKRLIEIKDLIDDVESTRVFRFEDRSDVENLAGDLISIVKELITKIEELQLDIEDLEERRVW